MNRKQIRLLIVSEVTYMRMGLRSMLSPDQRFSIVGESTNDERAVEMARDLQPDIVIFDMSEEENNSLELARAMRVQRAHLKVMIFLPLHKRRAAERVMQESIVDGFLSKHLLPSELCRAVEDVKRGERFFSTDAVTTLQQTPPPQLVKEATPDRTNILTAREKEVLQLIADGYTNKATGGVLGIGIRTCETHRANIMKKLGINNVAELTRYAIAAGISTIKTSM